MSSANAIQLASSIQSKVGSSLIAANSLLPRPEAAGVIAQAGGASLGVFLLRDLHEMQERTYQCVEKVATILQSQLDIAEEAERRARDQAAELKKKKPENSKGWNNKFERRTPNFTSFLLINCDLFYVRQTLGKMYFSAICG